MNLHKPFKPIIALMLIIAMAAGMAASMGGKADAVSVKVTLYGNGGTINGSSQKVLSANSGAQATACVTLPSTIPSRSKYWFAGWGLSSGTSTVTYLPGQNIYISKNTNLYAVWVRQDGVYRVAFNSNGGTYVGKYDYNCKEYWAFTGAGQNLVLPANKFTAPNRRFGGWSLTPGGTAKYAKPGENQRPSIKPTSNMTLYPRWQVQIKVHIMQAQPAKTTGSGKTEIKEVETVNIWEYENVTLKDAVSIKAKRPDGYYFGDIKGNKLSDSTLMSLGTNVYVWPCHDTITLNYKNTYGNSVTDTVIVYTGLSIASSFKTDGYAYNLALENLAGWKFKNDKSKIYSPGCRLICHGENFSADEVNASRDQTDISVWGIHMSADELYLMLEIARADYFKNKPSSSDEVKTILTQAALLALGIKTVPYLSKLSGIGGGIGGLVGAILDAFSNDTGTKDNIPMLYGALNSLVGAYPKSSAIRNKTFLISMKYKYIKGHYYIDASSLQSLN